MRTIFFDSEKIQEAIMRILNGTCKKVVVDESIKVYECQNVIRIDLKIQDAD